MIGNQKFSSVAIFADAFKSKHSEKAEEAHCQPFFADTDSLFELSENSDDTDSDWDANFFVSVPSSSSSGSIDLSQTTSDLMAMYHETRDTTRNKGEPHSPTPDPLSPETMSIDDDDDEGEPHSPTPDPLSHETMSIDDDDDEISGPMWDGFSYWENHFPTEWSKTRSTRSKVMSGVKSLEILTQHLKDYGKYIKLQQCLLFVLNVLTCTLSSFCQFIIIIIGQEPMIFNPDGDGHCCFAMYLFIHDMDVSLDNIEWMRNEIADFIDAHSDFFGVWFITGNVTQNLLQHEICVK